MELSNQVKISIVAGACLLVLVITLKNILNIPAETLSRDIILYIFITRERRGSRIPRPSGWG